MKKLLVYGKFDIVHVGHIRLLKYAKKMSDYLVVGLFDELCSQQTLRLDYDTRMNDLESLSFIDEIIKCTNVNELIYDVRPDYVLKGNEFANRVNDEAEVIAEIGAKLLFMSVNEPLEVKVTVNQAKYRDKNYAKSYRERHEIGYQDLSNCISNFKNLNGIVIGDLIFDQYIDCSPLGMSQEDKNIVYETKTQRQFVGGAGIVAAHCSGLGANLEFMTVVGCDPLGTKAEKQIELLGIRPKIFVDETRQTIRKTRYVWNNRNIFRASALSYHRIDKELEEKIIKLIQKRIKDLDFIILSDFNYGFLNGSFIEKIIQLAKENNVMISADSQSSSQIGTLGKYCNVDLVTPTEYEARSALQDYTSGLSFIGETLAKKISAQNLVLTLGKEGLLLFGEKEDGYYIDRLPAELTFEVDSSGAGDSLLSISTLAYTLSKNLELSCFLGSIAASIQVSRRGNTPLSCQTMLEAIQVFE